MISLFYSSKSNSKSLTNKKEISPIKKYLLYNYTILAAHCIFMIPIINQDPSEITVVVGENNQNVNEDGEEYIPVESIIQVFHI